MEASSVVPTLWKKQKVREAQQFASRTQPVCDGVAHGVIPKCNLVDKIFQVKPLKKNFCVSKLYIQSSIF